MLNVTMCMLMYLPLEYEAELLLDNESQKPHTLANKTLVAHHHLFDYIALEVLQLGQYVYINGVQPGG